MESQRNWKSFLLLDSPRERYRFHSVIYPISSLWARVSHFWRTEYVIYLFHLEHPSRYLDATVSSQFEKSFFPSPHILALQTSSFNFLTNSFDFFGGNYFRTWLKIHNPSSLWKSHFESCFLVFEFSRKKNRIASNDSKEKVVIYLILFEISDHPPSPFFPPSRPRRRLERRSLWLIGTHCTWESQV